MRGAAIVWDLSVDSTVCRAHQHAAGARKQGDLQKEPPGGIITEPDDHGLGRSRGGLTTKLHLAVEQGQKPMSIVVTAGQRGDSPQFEPVLEKVRVPRIWAGPARAPGPIECALTRRTPPARTAPTCVDAASAAPSRTRSTRPCNRKKLGSRGGRPPKFDKIDYRAAARGRVRHQSPQAPPGRGHRYDKLAVRYEATVLVAAINEWL